MEVGWYLVHMFCWLSSGSFLSTLQLQTSLHASGRAGDGGGEGEARLTVGFDVTVMPSSTEAAVVEVKLWASPASTAATVTLPGTAMVARTTTLPAVISNWTACQSIGYGVCFEAARAIAF